MDILELSVMDHETKSSWISVFLKALKVKPAHLDLRQHGIQGMHTTVV